MTESALFTWIDYLVVALVLALSSAVGFYYAFTGGRQRTTKEFLLADNSMHWFPVGASLVASFISTQTMIGTPSEVYSYGTIYGYIVPAIVLSGLFSYAIYLPVFNKLKVTSIYEVFCSGDTYVLVFLWLQTILFVVSFGFIRSEKAMNDLDTVKTEYATLRFGKEITFIAMITGVIRAMLYNGLVVYGPSITFSQATGLDLWVSVTILTAVSLLYTVMGGLKAVLWTDSLQFMIMVGGLFAAMIAGIVQAGGMGNIWEISKQSGRLDFMDAQKVFDVDPRARHTFWTQIIGGTILWTSAFGVSQSSVQRLLALKAEKDGLRAYSFASVALAILTLASVLTGLVIFYHFRFCDPLSNGGIATKDQVFGQIPGLSGLILSSIFSASLSTISTVLSSTSAIILQDIVRPLKPNITDREATIVSKVTCVVLSVVSLGLVAFARYQGHGILSMGFAFAGMMTGPIIAMFTVGIFNPTANKKGMILGFLTALVLVSWKGLGGLVHKPFVFKYPVTIAGCNVTDKAALANISGPVYDPSTWNPDKQYRDGVNALYDVSYMWSVVWGTFIACTVASLASLLLKSDDKVHKDLLSPICLRVMSLFPQLREKYIEMNGSVKTFSKLDDNEEWISSSGDDPETKGDMIRMK